MHETTDRQREFLELYEPLSERLERFVRSTARDRETARDVLAETVMVAYEGFDRLRDRKAFLSWLFTVAVRTNRRYRQRDDRTVSAPDGMFEELVAGGTPPDTAADVDRLHAALARLPEKEREAVVLFELSGLAMKEIAKIEGISTAAAKMRVSRGRKRLTELMTETDGIVEQPREAPTLRHLSTSTSPARPDRIERSMETGT